MSCLACSKTTQPQKYECHFSVIGGHGQIFVLEDIESGEMTRPDEIQMCSSYLGVFGHKINCPDNSQVIFHYSDSLTFLAVPEDGYKVNEWRNNGNIRKIPSA